MSNAQRPAAAALSSVEYEVLASARDELARAPHGSRSDIVKRVAQRLDISLQTAYRRLESAGYTSSRKRRRDCGECLASPDEIEAVAGVLRASLNNKGQSMPLNTCMDMLRASGMLRSDVSESTVARQLRTRRLNAQALAMPEPSVQLRSLHPNHVWQVDSTTGAYYYMPGGRLTWMPEDQFYKNKVSNLVKAAPDLLTRYSLTDHTTHAGKARHYLGGESTENLLDFLTWAMVKQDGGGPLHGVPFILMTDPGPANTSRLFKGFCDRLGMRLITHAPGSARVTGSVEKFHDLVRMHFETRLRFVDRESVTLDWLNDQLQAWTVRFCSHSVHSRHGKTRYGAWMSIAAEQLRVAASLDVLREAARSEPQTRRVSNEKRITFGSPSRMFDLSAVPGVIAGLKVTVAVNVFRSPAIDVQCVDAETGEETWHVVEPMERDAYGFGPGPVIGEEFRGAAFSDVDHARNRLLKDAYALPTIEEAEKARKRHAQAYAGRVDAMGDVHATPVPDYLPRRGTDHMTPTRTLVAPPLTVVEACKRLRDMLGPQYSPQVYAWVSAMHPDGVPEDQLGGIAAQFEAPADEQSTRAAGGLRLIGGGAA